MHCFSIKKTFVQAKYYNFFNDFRIVYVINKVADDKLRASRSDSDTVACVLAGKIVDLLEFQSSDF